MIKSSIIKSLPKEGYFWSRLNYVLVFLFSFFPLLFYLKKNKNDYLFIYLITSLPLLLVSIFDLNNQIIFRVSGKIRFTILRKLIFHISKKKIKKILIQTLESKNRILKKNIFDDKILNLIRDPIIDHKKIDNLKKEKIENKFLKKKYFVSIGRLTNQKNFLFLVKCLKKIIKKEKNFNFLILGEGKDRNKIERYILKYIFFISRKCNILG